MAATINRPEIAGKTPRLTSLSATPESANLKRLILKSSEISRVLGGGLVAGGVVLIAGEPGIGKSTLVLSLASDAAKTNIVFYASGEESPEQISARAARLGITSTNVKITSETLTENLIAAFEELRPALAVVDSIQTIRTAEVEAEAGSPLQVRAATARLTEAAKRLKIPLIIIGQVTKDGGVAGPKILEHLVDVVLSLEGDPDSDMRLLRALKNRFGRSDEVGLFLMKETGLEDLENPSQKLLQERFPGASGSAVTCSLEGSRPLFIEIQALVTPSPFQFPVRKTSGIDPNRLQMILAVLSKRANLNLAHHDILVSTVSGVTVKDPAADLAIALAVLSSHKDIALPEQMVALGEIGLGGELRSAKNLDRRLKEAQKLGFSEIIAASKPYRQLKEVLLRLHLT